MVDGAVVLRFPRENPGILITTTDETANSCQTVGGMCFRRSGSSYLNRAYLVEIA